jgi:Rad3-related DNA helicase
MYSAILYKSSFLVVKRIIKTKDLKLDKKLDKCNSDLLKLKRECDDCRVVEHITDFILHLMATAAQYEEFLLEYPSFDGRDLVLDLYFAIRQFLFIYEIMDDKYLIYTDYDDDGEFRIKLQCMDPSHNIAECLKKGRSSVFFSATLLPIHYYKEQLAGNNEDYAIYAPSPFDTKKRLLMVGKDVSTKYTRRSEEEYQKIAYYITMFTNAKVGNYLVFFPSYQMMNQVSTYIDNGNREIIIQRTNMSEKEKEEFLGEFTLNPEKTKVGLCVMGGIFGEGIDLKNDRLIGAVIVGTGLPMVCNERELFREYYDKKGKSGFEYSYLYSGMNKVLQSAGRVIRTSEDKGGILLLDERFMNTQYRNLFPTEWFPNVTVDKNNIEDILKEFWVDV